MTAFCEKYGWCVDHDDDHGSVKEPETAHAGRMVTLPVPPHQEAPSEEDPLWLMHAQIWATDKNNPTPRAYLAHDEGDELSMDADQLGEFIGQLGTFREELTAMREELLQAKAAEA